jgi:excisionase family DNA binding protein
MNRDQAEDRVGEGGLMTVDAAATYLSLTRPTVYKLMASGQLPYTKIGRYRRIPRQAVVALANRSLVAAHPPEETGPAPQ